MSFDAIKVQAEKSILIDCGYLLLSTEGEVWMVPFEALMDEGWDQTASQKSKSLDHCCYTALTALFPGNTRPTSLLCCLSTAPLFFQTTAPNRKSH